MNKREKILSFARTSEDRLLMSKVMDIAFESQKKNIPVFLQFLNGYEVTVAKFVLDNLDVNYKFYGGYDESERMVLSCYPEFIEPSLNDFPICVIKITGRDIEKLSHRDYLGSILALGIKREKIGDIVVFDDVTYVICMNDISEYIISQIRKIGNVGVKLELCNLSEISIPQKKYKDFDTIIPSFRADAVISAICHISRSKSAQMIKNGLLSVNWQNIQNISFICNTDDLFSIKGFGRFKLISANDYTRSGRIKIKVRQYL